MHIHTLDKWQHRHQFAVADERNERRTRFVVALTAVTMLIEIYAGLSFGSMALLADGWHMGTHVAALGIAVFTYRYARRHSNAKEFTFGTGKVGVLGGFASAVALAVVALLMGMESIARFFKPEPIEFNQALFVACLGLAVNILSALILQGRRPTSTDLQSDSHPHDHNLRAAYLHVLADALTSLLAVIALLAAKGMNALWPDPLMGLVGAALIGRWSYGLLRDTGYVLVDRAANADVPKAVRETIEADSDSRVSDLHIWQVAPERYAAVVSIVTHYPKTPEYYKALLAKHSFLAHVTVEVHLAEGEPCTVCQ